MPGRKKNPFPSTRVRLDGFVRRTDEHTAADPREQAFLEWYWANAEDRKAFTVAKDMLCAVLNGELGPQVKKAVEDGNTEEAIDALRDMLSVFAVDDS